jgi:hypothetical protein
VSTPPDPRSEVLIFIHIPKTAGTTFAAILERNFPRSRLVSVYPNFGISEAELRDLPDAARERVECIQGHFDYGIHRHLGRPFRYATFLRRPAEQVRSRYNHARLSRSHPLHPLVREGATLEEFVRVSPDNYQTRTLAGSDPVPGRGHPLLTERDLERVKANIERHFALVGIADRFDESLLLARRRLGLQRIRYVRRNVRRGTRRAPSPDDSNSVFLEDHVRLDVRLYEWARERLERAIETEGDAFQEELRAFRDANARYSRLMGPFDAASHRATKAARYAYRFCRKVTAHR